MERLRIELRGEPFDIGIANPPRTSMRPFIRRYSPGPTWKWALKEEPAGQSKIAVQAPISGEACSIFQRIPPWESASGNAFQGISFS